MNPGDRIGNLRVVGSLGAGGMGEVFVAVDEKLNRRVALKSIRDEHRMRPAAKARFLREARVLSSLDHANICRIYDLIEAEEQDVLVLELIEGRNLAKAIRAGLDPNEKLKIAMQIADVLVVAHAAGVVHRDLKPDNVMLTNEGDVKVLDFGLARVVRRGDNEQSDGDIAIADSPEPRTPSSASPLQAPTPVPDPPGPSKPTAATDAETIALARPRPTVTAASAIWGDLPGAAPVEWDGTGLLHTADGLVMGTPLFMSPEQARGEEVTASSDMFSFGLLLEAVFTGHSPYENDIDVTAVLEHARSGRMDPVKGVRSDLAKLIDQLKSASPSARPTAVQAARRLRWIRNRPKRRARRLAIAAVVVLGVGAGLKYTLDLRYERSVADWRRGQAEQLIGHMLGDLHKGLDAVGRLDLLDGVGDQAMQYFASIPENELSDDDLLRHAKALRQISEVRRAQGSLPRALTAIEEANSLTADLVRRDPEQQNWLFELAQTHFYIGNVYYNQNKLDAALDAFDEYERIARKLTSLNPKNRKWQLELAYAQGSLAAIYEARGELELALKSVRQSIVSKRALCRDSPENIEYRASLAMGLVWLGEMTVTQGDLAGALDHYQEALTLREQVLAANPTDTDLQLEVSGCHGFIGGLISMSGRTSEATQHFREMQRVAEGLVAIEPTNLLWQRDLAVARRLIGESLIAQGLATEALTELEASAATMSRLVAADPTNDDFRFVRDTVSYVLALTLLYESRPVDALRSVEVAVDGMTPVVEGADDSGSERLFLARALILRGRLAEQLGRTEDASADWVRAHDLIATSASGSRDPRTLDVLAQSLLHLKRDDEAAPILEQLRILGYQGHCLEELQSQRRESSSVGSDGVVGLSASRSATAP